MIQRALDIFRRRRAEVERLPRFGRINLKASELLVIQLPGGTPENERQRIALMVRAALRSAGLDNHVLIVSGEASFSTIGLADCP